MRNIKCSISRAWYFRDLIYWLNKLMDLDDIKYNILSHCDILTVSYLYLVNKDWMKFLEKKDVLDFLIRKYRIFGRSFGNFIREYDLIELNRIYLLYETKDVQLSLTSAIERHNNYSLEIIISSDIGNWVVNNAILTAVKNGYRYGLEKLLLAKYIDENNIIDEAVDLVLSVYSDFDDIRYVSILGCYALEKAIKNDNIEVAKYILYSCDINYFDACYLSQQGSVDLSLAVEEYLDNQFWHRPTHYLF